MRAWITFLHADQASADTKIVQWSQKYALSRVPLAVFEDVGGPPAYRLASEAEVTVVLYVKQSVVANYAFRTGELTETKVEEVGRSSLNTCG